jgi:hypothetical protein
MPRTLVVHCLNDEYDVYIGRDHPVAGIGDIWQNPFHITAQRSRKQAVAEFREWAPTQPQIMGRLEELRGKRIGCFCRTEAESLKGTGCECHGDVYLELLGEKALAAEQLPLF